MYCDCGEICHVETRLLDDHQFGLIQMEGEVIVVKSSVKKIPSMLYLFGELLDTCAAVHKDSIVCENL